MTAEVLGCAKTADVGATDACSGAGLNGPFDAADAGWLAQNASTMVVREKDRFALCPTASVTINAAEETRGY